MRYGVKARTVTSLRMAKSHSEADEAMIKSLAKPYPPDALYGAQCVTLFGQERVQQCAECERSLRMSGVVVG